MTPQPDSTAVHGPMGQKPPPPTRVRSLGDNLTNVWLSSCNFFFTRFIPGTHINMCAFPNAHLIKRLAIAESAVSRVCMQTLQAELPYITARAATLAP